MTGRRLGIGVVGCGNVSKRYFLNAALFPGVELRACADQVPAAAAARAAEFGIRALAPDALLAADDIDLVLNLTVPNAHFDISMAALTAGKHVFTEKPLAATAAQGRRLVAEAEARGLAIGSAPDTFLGAAGRLARRLVDEGRIGRPVGGTAFMMTRGMEHWHPDPRFFYQPGGGPVLDMGPYYLTMLVNLLGPADRVMAMATTGSAERVITGPGELTGTAFPVATPTHVTALVEFANQALVTLVLSWDVFRHGNHPIELHGTGGSLRLPDPDTFGGVVALSDAGGAWQDIATDALPFGRPNVPIASPDHANYRMLGLADLAASITGGGRARASGQLALHVLEILEAILTAAASGTPTRLEARDVRPTPLSEAEAVALAAPR
ncbi:MAG TPA: Gfo/Idh/MocA family oxidoreductase [Acetobacteraceae bacterium]|nr:Gfo/Idh/MocA family oxidoreductase [Acetobacteraceae bacterium]